MFSRIKGVMRTYLPVLLGAAILSFGLYNVHSQSNITEGGVLGLTLLLQHWLGISPAISSFVLDLTCYAIGFKFLGKSFLKLSIVTSVCFATCYSIYERFPPLIPNLSENPVLAAVAGGIFVGVGVGFVVRAGGASGGDDALALTISHLLGWKISATYLFTDLVVLALSATYIPLTRLLCSLITVTISSLIIGAIHKSKPADFPDTPEPATL